MKLYNPNFNKGSAVVEKIFNWLFWLVLLGGIAGVVCLIVFKYEWYYCVGCAVAAVILIIIFNCLTPARYVVINENPQLKIEPPEKVVIHSVDDDEFRGRYSVYGIRGGIAVCKCGNKFKPNKITYTVSNVKDNNRFDEYTNMTSTTTGNLRIECTCEKCREVYTEVITMTLETYSSVRKQEMFSDKTTLETKRTKTDVDEKVLELYEYDKKKYYKYKEEYDHYVKKQEDKNEHLKNKNLEKINKLKEKGWYEKGDGGHN